MRKLIEKQDSGMVVCDNPDCNFEFDLKKAPKVKLEHFIDMPCPYCSQNLLTRKDYDTWRALNIYINFINKWFSWTTIFMSKKKLEKSNNKFLKVHVHNGVNVEKTDTMS